jgi:hypothetical protein
MYTYIYVYTYICIRLGERWGFDGRGRFAHGGFLSVALSIREEIEESKILKNLLQQYPFTNNSFRESDSEYKLEEVRTDDDDDDDDVSLE